MRVKNFTLEVQHHAFQVKRWIRDIDRLLSCISSEYTDKQMVKSVREAQSAWDAYSRFAERIMQLEDDNKELQDALKEAKDTIQELLAEQNIPKREQEPTYEIRKLWLMPSNRERSTCARCPEMWHLGDLFYYDALEKAGYCMKCGQRFIDSETYVRCLSKAMDTYYEDKERINANDKH